MRYLISKISFFTSFTIQNHFFLLHVNSAFLTRLLPSPSPSSPFSTSAFGKTVFSFLTSTSSPCPLDKAPWSNQAPRWETWYGHQNLGRTLCPGTCLCIQAPVHALPSAMIWILLLFPRITLILSHWLYLSFYFYLFINQSTNQSLTHSLKQSIN